MLQIAAIVVGVLALVMGGGALAKGEVQLSRSPTLKDGSARIAGVVTILVGLAIIGFALIGIPLLTT
ncbi:MAG: hypothetical protein RIC55_17260 [Pirellulaceae bacterium]